MKNNPLIGKTIIGLKFTPERDYILFELAYGESIIAYADGDCCSCSWIESIEIPALGFPCDVLDVHDLDMPDLGDMDGCDVVSYYGLKIITNKGEIIIDYRNDSNGYYGGSLYFPGCSPFNSNYPDQDKSKYYWEDVKED